MKKIKFLSVVFFICMAIITIIGSGGGGGGGTSAPPGGETTIYCNTTMTGDVEKELALTTYTLTGLPDDKIIGFSDSNTDPQNTIVLEIDENAVGEYPDQSLTTTIIYDDLANDLYYCNLDSTDSEGYISITRYDNERIEGTFETIFDSVTQGAETSPTTITIKGDFSIPNTPADL